MNKNNTNRIHFMKMHGVGNDYIFVDTAQCAIPDPQTASIAWSRPHMGIGSDGLVLIGRAETPEADFTMRIFNADGSEGLMCGNASRCIGKYVYERGSGITMACGTGACATAVAAAVTGRAPRRSRVIMDGGTLDIEWSEADGHVYLTGPATIVFEGTIDL